MLFSHVSIRGDSKAKQSKQTNKTLRYPSFVFFNLILFWMFQIKRETVGSSLATILYKNGAPFPLIHLPPLLREVRATPA